MYYSSGNYEAFATPKKPEGIEGKSAYVVGTGLAGLAQEIPSAVAMVENLYIWGTVFAWAIIIVLMLTYKLDKEYNGILGDMEKKGMLKQAD